MPGAPFPQRVRKGAGKALAYVIEIPVAYRRGGANRQFPENLGQMIQEVLPVGLLIGDREVIGEREAHILLRLPAFEKAIVEKLRFVGENRRDDTAEMFANRLEVGLVRDLDELLHGGTAERVNVGLVVVARCRALGRRGGDEEIR